MFFIQIILNETEGDEVDEEEAGDRPVSHRFPYYASARQQDMEHPGELGLSDDDDDDDGSGDHLAASAARRLNLGQLPFPSLGDHDEEEEGGDDDDGGGDGDERRNGEIAAASEALGREIARVRELAKEADAGGGGGGSGWFYRYAGACRRLPRLVAPGPLASPFEEIVGTHAHAHTHTRTRTHAHTHTHTHTHAEKSSCESPSSWRKLRVSCVSCALVLGGAGGCWTGTGSATGGVEGERGRRDDVDGRRAEGLHHDLHACPIHTHAHTHTRASRPGTSAPPPHVR